MEQLRHCPICRSERFASHYRGRSTRTPEDGHTWSVDRCADCGLQFLNPQPAWEDLAAYYTADYNAYDSMHGARGQTLEAAVEAAKSTGEIRHIQVPRGKRLLDVGCGGGWFLRVAQQMGAEVYGVEPSRTAAEGVRSRGIEVFNGTVIEFSQAWRGPRFDVVTSNHVLEHAPNPVEVLEAMKSVLADDGFIWISVPNAACRAARLLRDRWHSTDLPFHLMQFTPQVLGLAAQRAGLSVRRAYTYSLPTAVASSVRQFLRQRLWIPHRLTERLSLIDQRLSPWMAARIDAHGSGEAVVTELVPASRQARSTQLS